MADVRFVAVLLMLISSSMCGLGHVIEKRDLKSIKVAFEIDLFHEEKDFVSSTPSNPTRLTRLKANSFSSQGFTADTKINFTISNREDVPDTIDVKKVDSQSCHIIVTGPIDRDTMDFAKHADDTIVIMVKAMALDDSKISATMKVNLELEDSNDCPPVFTEDTFYAELTEMSLPQDVNPVLRVAATDADKPDDGNGRVTYATSGIFRIRTNDGVRENVADPGSLFGVDAESGDIEVRAQIDREKSSTFIILVVASDNPTYGETLRATATATIVIKDIKDNPPVCSRQPVVCTVPEDFPVETNLPESCNIKCTDLDESQSPELVYTTTAADDDYTCPIKVLPGGAVQLFESLDWEADSVHRCIITLVDPGIQRNIGLAHTTYQRFTLNVEDVYEPTTPIPTTTPPTTTTTTTSTTTTASTTTTSKPTTTKSTTIKSATTAPTTTTRRKKVIRSKATTASTRPAYYPTTPSSVPSNEAELSPEKIELECMMDKGIPTMRVMMPKVNNGKSAAIGICSDISFLPLPPQPKPDLVFTDIQSNKCGTVLHVSKNKLVYSNVLTINQLSADGLIIRYERFWNLKCTYPRRYIKSIYHNIKRPPSSPRIVQTGTGVIPMEMAFYDKTFTNALMPPLFFNFKERVYVQVTMATYDDLELALLNCWATQEKDPKHHIRQDLIKDTCDVEETLQRHDATNSVQKRFSYKAFRFLNSYSVFLHCEYLICKANDLSSRCSRGCQNRSKRAISGGFFLMSQNLGIGPFIVSSSLQNLHD